MSNCKVRNKETTKPQPQGVWSDEPLPEGSLDMELAAILSERGWVRKDGPGNEYWTYPESPDLPAHPHGDESQETFIMLNFPRNREPHMAALASHDDRAGLLADPDKIETWRAGRVQTTDSRTGSTGSEP